MTRRLREAARTLQNRLHDHVLDRQKEIENCQREVSYINKFHLTFLFLLTLNSWQYFTMINYKKKLKDKQHLRNCLIYFITFLGLFGRVNFK